MHYFLLCMHATSGISFFAAGSMDRLNPFVKGTADDICLLLGCQLNKIYGISADPDCQLWVIFRVLLCIYEHISVQYIDIQMMSSLCSIAIQKIYEIVELGCVRVHKATSLLKIVMVTVTKISITFYP